MDSSVEMSQLQAAKSRYERELLRKKNVVGVGIGFRQVDGQLTDQLALTVLVQQKLPLAQLRKRDVVPSQLDGVLVDVQEVGTFQAKAVQFTAGGK